METFVIVGGGLAAGKATETLRAEGFDGRLVVVTEEGVPPYERPPLSKGVLLGDDSPEVVFAHDAAWYAEHDVDLRLDTTATALDLDERRLTLDGAEPVRFDRLLLATGSAVRPLPVPGAGLPGVAYLRTLPQSLELRDRLRGGGRVVVVGAGWIGLEVAAAARHHGCEVTVVEPQSTALAGPLGPKMGEVFAGLHREHGVDLRFGRQVVEVLGDDDGVRALRLDDDERLDTHFVVVGIGVTPRIDLPREAGLDVHRGVLADAALRTSDDEVFVAGDIAEWQHPLLATRVRVEHWANAQASGEVAARSMLGQEVSYDALPFFFTDQYDLGMEYSGFVDADGYDEVVTRGDVGSREFCAFWLRDGRVLAGMNVNVWDVQDDIQALIRSRATVDRTRLADPGTPLAELEASATE